MALPKQIYREILKDLQTGLDKNEFSFKEWSKRFKIVSEDYEEAYGEPVSSLLYEEENKKEKYFNSSSTTQDLLKVFIEKAKNASKEEQEKVLNDYVDLIYKHNDVSYKEAKAAAIKNLGYLFGYCDNLTRELVYQIYNLRHPIFDKEEEVDNEQIIYNKK